MRLTIAGLILLAALGAGAPAAGQTSRPPGQAQRPPPDASTGPRRIEDRAGALAAAGRDVVIWSYGSPNPNSFAFGLSTNYAATAGGEPMPDFKYVSGYDKLYTRSLMLGEYADAVDLSLSRADGAPGAPLPLKAGDITGLIYWRPFGTNGAFASDKGYGRVAQIYGRAYETPTGRARGGALGFGVTPLGEETTRERVWISPDGFLIVAGKVCYEDRAECDSSNYRGKGALTVLASDDSVAPWLAVRAAPDLKRGFDFLYDAPTGDLIATRVAADVRRPVFRVTGSDGGFSLAGGLAVAGDATLGDGDSATRVNGRLLVSGGSPTPTACGQGASTSAGASDNAGWVTNGAGAVRACTVRFSRSFGSARPVCQVQVYGSPTTAYLTALDPNGFTAAFSADHAGGTWSYICLGQS